MSQLIEAVVSITSNRDRERIDLAIVEVIMEVLQPRAVRFFRLLQDRENYRVCKRVEADRDGLRSSPLLSARRDLPAIETFPGPQAMLERKATGEVVAIAGIYCTRRVVTNGQGAIGWIEVDTIGPLTADHARLLDGLVKINANHLSILDYSEHDSLTGLLNRKTFDDAFMRLYSPIDRMLECEPGGDRRRREGTDPHWLGVLDIDHFKSINDRFGHLFGDEVLRIVAHMMRLTFRLSDQMFRFGGEEFVVLLDRVKPGDINNVVERLRKRIEGHSFPRVGQVTISTGYTMIRAEDSATTAFGRADNALYHAKTQGRNRCASSTEALAALGVAEPEAICG